MNTIQRLSVALAAVALSAMAVALSAVAAGAQSLHFEDTVIQAQQKKEKHVRELTQTLVMPFDAPDGGMVCGSYGSTLAKGSRGTVQVDIEIQRADDVETHSVSEKVSNNAMSECVDTGPLEVGDVVIFDFLFKNFPKMSGTEARRDIVEISGAVTTFDRPGLPTTGAGGPLSIDDQMAVNTLASWARGARGVALRFESQGVIIDWRFSAEDSDKLPGFHPTIAKAVAAFCKIVKDC